MKHIISCLLIATSAYAAFASSNLPPQPYRQITHGSTWTLGPATPEGSHLFLSASGGVHLLNRTTGLVDKSFYTGAFSEVPVTNYAYAHDANILYAFGPDAAYTWNWESGAATRLPDNGHGARPDFVLRDGRWVFGRDGGRFAPVHIVDPATGATVQTLLEDQINARIVISADATTFAAIDVTQSYAFLIYDLATEELQNTINVPRPDIQSTPTFALSPTGDRLAVNFESTSSVLNPSTSVWDTTTGTLLQEKSPGYGNLWWWLDNDQIITWFNGKNYMVNAQTLELIQTITPSMDQTFFAEISPDGTELYYAGIGDSVPFMNSEANWLFITEVVDTATGEITYTHKTLSSSGRDFAFDATAQQFTLLNSAGFLNTWTTTEGYRESWPYNINGTPADPDYPTIAMTRAGDKIACWEENMFQLSVWSPTGQRLGGVYPQVSRYLEYPSFSPGGSWLLARDDFSTTVWNADTLAFAASLPDYAAVFTGRDEKEVLRITPTQIIVGPFDGPPTHQAPILYPDGTEMYRLGVSRNGEYFWGITWEPGALVVGSVATGAYTWFYQPDIIRSHKGISISNDGKRVAFRAGLSGIESLTGVWDVASKERILELPLGMQSHFSDDDEWLYSDISGIVQWAATIDACAIQCGNASTDTDADGLSDCVETCYQIDPDNPDTDGDYLPDGYEASNGHEAHLPDAGSDDDTDGLGLYAETYYGTNPTLPDTDGDGATDLAEILAGTNPLINENAVEGEGTAEGISEGDGSTEGETEGIAEGTPDGAVEGESSAALAATLLQRLHEADTNRDLRIQPAEFEALALGNRNDFDALDTNADGALTVAELLHQSAQPAPIHSADLNADGRFSLSELIRVIQLHNAGGYACAPDTDTEDGYQPAAKGAFDPSCRPHASDYQDNNGTISLSELLRLIQLYTIGTLTPCPEAEDGFCAAV